jgi:hypothetical protein
MTEKPILLGPDGIEPITLRDALEERYLAATVAPDNKLIAHLDNAVRDAKADAGGPQHQQKLAAS